MKRNINEVNKFNFFSDCFPAYSGILCEILTCSDEPAICSLSFDVGSCISPIINSFCPKLCGACGTAPITTTACPRLNCLNGGSFNDVTCAWLI